MMIYLFHNFKNLVFSFIFIFKFYKNCIRKIFKKNHFTSRIIKFSILELSEFRFFRDLLNLLGIMNIFRKMSVLGYSFDFFIICKLLLQFFSIFQLSLMSCINLKIFNIRKSSSNQYLSNRIRSFSFPYSHVHIFRTRQDIFTIQSISNAENPI